MHRALTLAMTAVTVALGLGATQCGSSSTAPGLGSAGGSAGSGAAGQSGAAAGVTAAAGSSAANGGNAAGGSGPEGDTAGATDTVAGAAGAAPCALTASGPVTATQDGEVIENLLITATGQPGITISGFKNVSVRNVEINHSGAVGILVENSDGTKIDGVSVTCMDAPASGQNPTSALNNIECQSSANFTLSNARLTRGSTGVYLLSCEASQLSFIEGHDFRGPFPRGQLVQWDKSNDATLQDFSAEDPATSWTEDNVNVYQSTNVTIRRGLVDGNNSPSGDGVIFDQGGAGTVTDVDAVHMGNGCFGNAGLDGNIFTNVRCRDNICTSQEGRGVPSSNALMFASTPGHTMDQLVNATYFNPCNPGNIVWPTASFVVEQDTEASFTPRAPLALHMCWE